MPGESVCDPMCGGGSISVEVSFSMHNLVENCLDVLHVFGASRQWINFSVLLNSANNFMAGMSFMEVRVNNCFKLHHHAAVISCICSTRVE